MKILFITDECFAQSGGGTYIRALIKVFEKIAGESNFTVFFPYEVDTNKNCTVNNIIMFPKQAPSVINKIIDSLVCMVTGTPYLFSKESINYILNLIEREEYDCVVAGRSFYGNITKAVKMRYPQVLTITFFHDIIDDAIKQMLRKEKKSALLKKLPKLLCHRKNEYVSLRYSDKNVVLNYREKEMYKKYYHTKPDAVIPIFATDCFDYKQIQEVDYSICNILFVGGYFWPNLIGIKWFVENVMSKLNSHYVLYIVGRNMEKVRKELEIGHNNVKVIGTVDCLDEWYYKADIVVGPIFDGSGMKTKTVEALMYGKIYLGTEEALCGYQGMEDYLCNTADEFISKINQYWKQGDGWKFSKSCRQLYLDNYSEEAIKRELIKLLFHLKK